MRGEFDKHEDGGGQGKDVIRLNDLRVTARPDLCQVKDWKYKPADVRWESIGNNRSVKKWASFCLLANCKEDVSG